MTVQGAIVHPKAQQVSPRRAVYKAKKTPTPPNQPLPACSRPTTVRPSVWYLGKPALGCYDFKGTHDALLGAKCRPLRPRLLHRLERWGRSSSKKLPSNWRLCCHRRGRLTRPIISLSLSEASSSCGVVDEREMFHLPAEWEESPRGDCRPWMSVARCEHVHATSTYSEEPLLACVRVFFGSTFVPPHPPRKLCCERGELASGREEWLWSAE